jgi:chromosome segregation ATPase
MYGVERIKLELPSKLNEICHFSFDIDNLIKVLDYFFNNNVIVISEIKDIKSKVKDIDTLHEEIEKLKLKTMSIEKTHENINRSFLDMKDRFIKNESKVADIVKKNAEIENSIERNEKMLDGHDSNLNNLNRVVEENIKSIKQIQENFGINLEKMHKFEQKINEIHQENIKTHELIEKNKNKSAEDQNNNQKQIDSINGNIYEIDETIKQIKTEFEKKYRDFDNCINNIMDTVTNMVNKGTASEQNDKNLFKLTMNEIEREREKFNSFIEEHKHSQEKRDKENDTLKKIVDSIKIDINNVKEKINTTKAAKAKEEEKGEKKSVHKFEINTTMEDSVQKLNEYIKKITKTISTLPNREEFETLNRNITSRVNKIEQIHKNGLMNLESKTNKKSFSINKDSDSNKNENISLNYLNSWGEKFKHSILGEINETLKDMIKKEGKHLDISKNPQILEIIRIITQHSEDINNNNKTVIDLRKTIFSIEVDKKFNILVEKTNQLEEEVDRNKKKIFELIKTIDGFEDEGEEGQYQPETIKGKLNLLEKTYNNMSEKLIIIEARYKSLSKEIKDDVKSSLRIETVKTVGQFREKLEIFTRRFEEELRNKIDQMGLNNFEKRMNTKIYYNLKDKLNRNEMQKNNNVINRKIDSLENKISKTLVDTIIDLQMDEAPLIIKKTSNNMDICASCNQIIKDRGYVNTAENSQSSQNINKNLSTNNKNDVNNKFRKTFYGFNRTQTSMPKINNVMNLRKDLPDINKNNS